MQPQQYFVVVLAHSLHGRLRRVHIPHRAIYAVLVFAAIGLISVCGFVLSYARMTWKVANYNSLRNEIKSLRVRYRDLQRETNQKNEQLASLQLFANEVSMAYGLNRKAPDTEDPGSEMNLIPTYRESLDEYNLLQSASYSRGFHDYARRWQTNVRPSLWPVNGHLLSSFGGRADPFSGEGSVHTGVDLSAAMGTPVHVTADGVVIHAAWFGGYGRLIVVDHGNGLQTYYAHLSRFEVVTGQEVRRGEVIAESGSSGRATAPHLHYEVRLHGTPVNPYPYLAKSALTLVANRSKDFPF